MEKCSLEDCENECFEQENKCILHCDKSILIDYLEKNINDKDTLVLNKIDFPENFNYQIIFDKSKAIEFWNCTFNNIENQISILNHRRIHFYGCKFNKRWIHINIDGIVYSNCDFYDEIFFERDLNNGENKIYTLAMHDCNVYKKFDLDFDAINLEQCNIKMLHLDNSVFHEKVKIKNCKIENHSFINTRFKSLADFYKTEFCSNLFFKTTFEDIVVFTESKFHKDVNFKYTTFEKLALFRKTIFEKTVNFEDSIFKEEANFLNITANMANRETARIIKNSFEQQNNIIEANKFYALEMKKREKELEILKNPLEWIVFKLHGISSNHSQSWLLPLFWITIVSYLYILFSTKFNLIESFLYNLMIKKNLLNEIADLINPFSIMTSKDPMTFGLLLFKITIAYLIYQFIVSVRQNTRRK